jgi:hypothetical protein
VRGEREKGTTRRRTSVVSLINWLFVKKRKK